MLKNTLITIYIYEPCVLIYCGFILFHEGPIFVVFKGESIHEFKYTKKYYPYGR